jgi:hypothetical protein
MLTLSGFEEPRTGEAAADLLVGHACAKQTPFVTTRADDLEADRQAVDQGARDGERWLTRDVRRQHRGRKRHLRRLVRPFVIEPAWLRILAAKRRYRSTRRQEKVVAVEEPRPQRREVLALLLRVEVCVRRDLSAGLDAGADELPDEIWCGLEELTCRGVQVGSRRVCTSRSWDRPRVGAPQ